MLTRYILLLLDNIYIEEKSLLKFYFVKVSCV